MNGARRLLSPAIALPLFFLVLTTVYLAAIFDIRAQFADDGGIGPRTIPLLAAFCMYGALCVVLVREWRHPGTPQPAEASEHGLWRPLGVIVATGAYILLFRHLGYTLSTLAFVAALFVVFEFQTRRPLGFALGVIGVTAVFYGLFAGIFSVRLPTLTEGFL